MRKFPVENYFDDKTGACRLCSIMPRAADYGPLGGTAPIGDKTTYVIHLRKFHDYLHYLRFNDGNPLVLEKSRVPFRHLTDG